jgi:hypothetical protein
VSDSPGGQPRGKIRRIISPGGRHRTSTGKPSTPLSSVPLASSPSPRPQVLRQLDPPDQNRLDSIVTAYQQMVLERVDQGVAHMQQQATRLMSEIATEVWRTVGPEAGENLSDRVLGLLARDDTVRGLISHSDERYHALDVRIQRMEAGLRMVAEKLKQSHLALVSDMEGMRQAITGGLGSAFEHTDRQLAAISAQVDTTGRRLHSRLVHAAERIEGQNVRIAARLEQTPIAAQLDTSMVAMTEGLQALDRAMHGLPDMTARRVANVTGMMSDQVEAAAGQLVRRIAKVTDHAVERVISATETAAGRAVTTTEALAARVAARTEAVAGRALRATEELAERVGETTEDAAERALAATEGLAARMEATSEALVNRFDAMGRVLVRTAARESEAVVGLDKALRDMQNGLEDMGTSLEAIKRDLTVRPLSAVADEEEMPEAITSIDAGFFGRDRRRRRAAS